MTDDNQSGGASPEAGCYVMDVVEDEDAAHVPLSSRCYWSGISNVVLESVQTAQYRCRWIHVNHEGTFEEFLGIVEQTLQTRRDDERRMIIAALRRLRHQQELKGMNGPSFRPGVFPLFTDEWHESLLHYLQETEPSDDQPMFVAIPTLQEGVPWPRSQADSNRNPMQNAKSLLEYHYRFNGGLTNASGMDGFISPTPVNVSELWCLVVDKKNIITASPLAVNLLWPNAGSLQKRALSLWVSSSFSHAFWQHSTLHTTIMSRLNISKLFQVLDVGIVALTICHLLPFASGLLAYIIIDAVIKRLYGLAFSTSAKLISLSVLMIKAEENSDPQWQLNDELMRSSAAFKINRVRAADDIKLRSLWDYVKKWTSVEASMRFRVHEGGFSEEIFTTLKELWTIALIFSANFYLNSKDRQIYALGPRSTTEWTWSSWRRRHTKLKQQGGSTESNALDIPIYHSPRKPGETLRDLEEDLSKTMAKLDRQLEFEKNRFDSENDDDREKALLMEEISRSGDNASLYCLLRVCTFSTPSRFTTFNNLVVDFYARKISRLEWFIRDRVTQSLVYELSRLEDELRIAKDIILSQRNVVSKIAEKFSAAVSAEGTPTPERTDLNGETGSNRKNEDTHRSNKVSQTRTTHRRSTHAVNTLPAKARAKHDTLLADLDKLADTVERLKRQAALLLEIKTEGQNTAIFVFTIVTVIFLPLSFVTGYFGMNTSDIRNLDQGQWIFWAVGLTLTLIILMVVWLISVKERGWRTSRQARRLQYAEW